MMRRRTTLLTGCTALVLALGATACGGGDVSAGGGDKALNGQTETSDRKSTRLNSSH